MSYAVRILPVAAADRESIFRYILDRSPQGALAWETAYENALRKLRENPLLYGLASESNGLEIDLRQLLFSTRSGHTYRIVFRIDSDTVTIYRLRGPGQAPLGSSDISS